MKKLSQMFCNLLLMAVIDGLLIYTELGTAHPFQGDTKKILLIAIGDLGYGFYWFCGETD